MLHARIAQAIRTNRHGRLSAQQLADETERLGYGISRSQIANYESGRKKSLDVAELLVIADQNNLLASKNQRNHTFRLGRLR